MVLGLSAVDLVKDTPKADRFDTGEARERERECTSRVMRGFLQRKCFVYERKGFSETSRLSRLSTTRKRFVYEKER